MSKPKPIKQRVQEIIDDRRKQLEKERDYYREKMYETSRSYGVGGAYQRQEKAADERERQLDELDSFERQLRRTIHTKKITVYAFGCRKCMSVCMSTSKPTDRWHECPVCRDTIFLSGVPSKELEVTEECEVGEWLKRVTQLREEIGE